MPGRSTPPGTAYRPHDTGKRATDAHIIPENTVTAPLTRGQRRTARRDARARRRTDIDTRARLLAGRQADDTSQSHWSLHVAIGIVGALWALGCWWQFAEQVRFARHLGFAHPQAFPAIVDGLAFAAAMLAYGIGMSGRTAGGSRVFSAAVNLLSAAACGTGAWHRSHDVTVVVVAALVPLVLMWGFHLILAEMRLRIQIGMGRQAEKAPPGLRLVRMVFAGPRWALVEWLAAGREVTDPLPRLPAAAVATVAEGSAARPEPAFHDPGTAVPGVPPAVPPQFPPGPAPTPIGLMATLATLVDAHPTGWGTTDTELAAELHGKARCSEETARKYIGRIRRERSTGSTAGSAVGPV